MNSAKGEGEYTGESIDLIFFFDQIFWKFFTVITDLSRKRAFFCL